MRLLEIGMMEVRLHAHSRAELRGVSHASWFLVRIANEGDAAIALIIIRLSRPVRYGTDRTTSTTKTTISHARLLQKNADPAEQADGRNRIPRYHAAVAPGAKGQKYACWIEFWMRAPHNQTMLALLCCKWEPLLRES